MIKESSFKSYALLHFVVLIYGFTAILGRFITVPAIDLVWYRMVIAMGCFVVWLLARKKPIKLPLKDTLYLLGIGAVVALHWISFFGAIKLSNISVTLGCMAATTLFTSILEPLLSKKRFDTVEILLGAVIIGGLYMIFQFETHYLLGILVALTSAFLASLFTVLNGRVAQRIDATLISGYEMLGGVVVLSLILLFQGKITPEFFNIPTMDWVWIVILATICTAFAFSVSVWVMKKLSSFSVVLAINMEPIYGILLALFFFNEDERMSLGFYIGTALIIVAVVLYPLLKSKRAIVK